ncbi:hypothetical protein CCACVL1_27792 [Corchorus capsularis]|uniref:Uncharacterized protein n=1 Tax=Corchorus capsularis TaxID=210143 RepID=A0A1R3G8V8_COCAP|nr:hypothetical protein CCACVL1_27792 [Corchorus capsularis]
MILLVQIMHGNLGCHVEERKALLELKAYVNSNGKNADHFLPSWVEQIDCCLWERVTCSNITRHVVHLSLGSLFSSHYENILPLNISIFQPFMELRLLNLSTNGIWIEDGHKRSRGMLKLKQLETLDLSYNNFTNSSLHSLSALTSLKNLNLRMNNLEGRFPVRELSVLENLESLDLEDNMLEGSLTLQDLKYLSKLSKLEYLDLGGNKFKSNDFVMCLVSLPSLKSLNLKWNYMEGCLCDQDFKYVTKLSKLEYLDLGGNRFTNKDIVMCLGALPSLKFINLNGNSMGGPLTDHDLQALSKLSKLEYLNLGGNKFKNKDIVRCLGFLPSLKSLNLTGNSMEGFLSDEDLKELTRLEVLDLSMNNLVGNIPSSVAELTSLKAISLAGNYFNDSLPAGICELNGLEELDLAYNSLEGIIPPCLYNMTTLRFIDLSHNHFDGTFNFSSLANLNKLEMVILTCDGNKLKTDAEYVDQIPLFQLRVLKLSHCNLESIPKFLFHQFRLQAIDLSRNNLSGTFPTWLAENNTDLEFLNLRSNSFSGQFYPSTNSMRNLQWIDVSSNELSGKLQDDLGKIFLNAKLMNLSNNQFEGNLPNSICVNGMLEGLDLSNNNFSGEIPKELFSSCTNLKLLVLSHNKFHGEIFSTNSSSLRNIQLRDNQFTSNLSLSNIFYQVAAMDVLDVSNNKFEGEIPSSIFNLNWIGILALGNNLFEGEFPCKGRKPLKVDYLDISYNSLRGPLPYCFQSNYLKQLHVEGNRFSGSIPSPLLNFSALRVLNLKHNHLVGNIPFSINGTHELRSLRILLLGNNSLNGAIPELVCRLKNISIMDLSKNFFSGPLPSCLYNISWGNVDITSISLSQECLGAFTPPPDYEVDRHLLTNPVFLTNFEFPKMEVEVDFITKNRLDFYKGNPLDLMSGLDLSCNNLSGEIPPALGRLTSIHALNLSHNQLVGSIPISFSELAQIESLDLSYNGLIGKIPSELGNLNFLQVFDVGHNNLSGEIPQATQFSTFNQSSFEGNPLLCGMQVKKNCSNPDPPDPNINVHAEESEGKWYEFDSVAFYACFGTTYVVIFLASMTVLYINPLWRRRWFLFIDKFIYSCC